MNSTAWLDNLFGSLELSSIVVGLPLNSATITYFFSQRHHLPSLLYLLIVVTDLFILISCFPSALSMLNSKQSYILSNTTLCTISGFLFNIASRMSVFLVALMAVARATVMVLPFRRNRMWLYRAVFALYLFVNVSLATLPLIYSDHKYYYLEMFGACSWGIQDLKFVPDVYSSVWYWLTYTTIIIPWLVPGLVVLVSCAVAVCALIRAGNHGGLVLTRTRTITKWRVPSMRGNRMSTVKATTHATITILITTGVYIMFNVPCWAFYGYFLSGKKDNPVKWLRGETGMYINIFLYRLSVVMNSAVNPVIYLCRMNALRRHNVNSAMSGLQALSWVKNKLQTVIYSNYDKSDVESYNQIPMTEINHEVHLQPSLTPAINTEHVKV